jgi:hypothetical protein
MSFNFLTSDIENGKGDTDGSPAGKYERRLLLVVFGC